MNAKSIRRFHVLNLMTLTNFLFVVPCIVILGWRNLRSKLPQIVWSVPEAAITVLCTPDNGRAGRPKHAE